MVVILFLLILFQTGYQFEIDHWGNHFVLTFLQNGNGEVTNSLVITTREESNISVTFHEMNQTEELHLNADESHAVFFNASTTAIPSMQVLPLKAVSIEASKAISVYGFTESVDSMFHSKEGFLVLPVPSLGVEYLAVTCAQGGPQIAVAAVENNTEVEIQIRCDFEVQCYLGLNVSTYLDNHVLTFLLNEHDVVNLYCVSDTTGSIVRSTKPVTVISGCSCWPNMIDCGHIVEMMPPTTEQGRQFVVATPTATSFAVLTIVSTNDLTVNDITGASYSFQTHSRFQYITVSEPEFCINSDKPMIVVMYIANSYASTSGNSDILMTVVPPLNKYAHNYSINIEANPFTNLYTSVAVLLCQVENCPSNSIGFKSICQGRYNVKRENISGFTTWRSSNPFNVFILARSDDTWVGYPAGMAITDYSGGSECSSNPCFNNGGCLEHGTTYRCRCWGGYSGDHCEKDPVESGLILVTDSTLKTTSSLQTTDPTTVFPITTDILKGTKVTDASTQHLMVPALKTTASTSGPTMSTLQTTASTSGPTMSTSKTTASTSGPTMSTLTSTASTSGPTMSTLKTTASTSSGPTMSTSNTVASTHSSNILMVKTSASTSRPKIPMSNSSASTPWPGKQTSDSTKPLDIVQPQAKYTAVSISDTTVSATCNSTITSHTTGSTTGNSTITPDTTGSTTGNSTISSDTTVPTTGNPTTVTTSMSVGTNTPIITGGLDTTTPVFTKINTTSPMKKILRLCGCPCTKSAKKNNTPKLVTVEEILQVSKEKLSKTQRRKHSADNMYASETNLGYSACSMLLFVVLLIVITDVCKIVNWFIEWRKRRKAKASVLNP